MASGFVPAGEPAPPPAASTAPAVARKAPVDRPKIKRARRRVLSAMLLLVALGGALAVVGLGQVRGSTAGRYVDPSLGPDQPGYAAFVTPTPTLLVVHKAADGQLGGVSLLSLQSGDGGGSVIVLPTGTRATLGAASTTLAQTYATGGAEDVTGLVEHLLRVAVEETIEIDDSRWSTLVEPVGQVPLRLESAVGNWSAGEVALNPADIGPFLAARIEGQSELKRTERQELFWRAWVAKVAEAGPDAIPGEVESGLGRFVRGLAAGLDDVAMLPVAAEPDLPDEQFTLEDGLVGDLVARSIPYPQSPAPGVRMRIRLLNGTQQPELTEQVAERLVRAGAEITIIGNAASFQETATRIIYNNRTAGEQSVWYQVALGGIGVVEDGSTSEDAASTDEAEQIDMTVILGADAPQALGR